MIRPSIRAVVLASTMAFVASCGGGSGSGGGSTPNNPIDFLPFLESTIPDNGESNVSPSTVISAEFSEPMDPATITEVTFAVRYGVTPVAGVITHSADNRTATFTPSAPILLGMTYTVTATAAISSLSGQFLTGDYSWNFMTRQPTWSVSTLSTDLGAIGPDFNLSAPDIAIDEEDNAVAVWGQDSRVAARLSTSSGWGPSAFIDNGFEGIRCPVVGVDGSGQILAAWGTGTALWCARNAFNFAGIWQSPEEIVAPGSAPTPRQLLVDAAGNALLFYTLEQAGSNFYVIRYDAVDGWGVPAAIPDRFDDGLPVATMDRASGLAVVIWSEGLKPTTWPGGFQVLKARRFVPGSGWTADETVGPDEPNRALVGGSLAADGQGNLIAMWLRQRTEGTVNHLLFYDMEIHFRRCTAAGWGPDEMGPNTTDHDVFYKVDGACNADGIVTALWYDWLNPVGGMRACTQISSTDWGDQTLMDYMPGSETSGLGITQPFPGTAGRFGVIGGFAENVDAGSGRGWVWVSSYVNGNWGQATVLHASLGYLLTFRRDYDSAGRAAAIWLEHTEYGPYGSSPIALRAARYR